MGMDGPTGLDYHGCEAAARLSGLEVDVSMFRLLQALEGARLRWLSVKREEQRESRETGGGVRGRVVSNAEALAHLKAQEAARG
jgi:hypothetical protein